MTEAARSANFTNEVGADGRIRFLRNVMGLWMLSESIRHWERDGARIDLAELLDQAAACPPPTRFRHRRCHLPRRPETCPAASPAGTHERGLNAPTTAAETARAIIESLAAAFADSVERPSRSPAPRPATVHLVGGGRPEQAAVPARRRPGRGPGDRRPRRSHRNR